MRDLSRSVGKNSSLDKKVLLRLGIVIIFLGVGLVLVKNFILPNSAGGNSSVSLRDAPFGLEPVSVGNTKVSEEGVDLTTQTATFRDVKYDGSAKANATRSFGGGTYILTVEATLPDPVNTHYQVWLASDIGFLPIDYMTGSKNSWSLNLRDSDKYSKYDGIWITLERTKDEIPEEHVLEGSF